MRMLASTKSRNPLSSRDGPLDEAIGVTLGIVALAGLIALVVFGGLILLPVAIVGAIVTYWLYNYYLPRKREERAKTRQDEMFREASKIAPREDDFVTQIIDVGFMDDTLISVASRLYENS